MSVVAHRTIESHLKWVAFFPSDGGEGCYRPTSSGFFASSAPTAVRQGALANGLHGLNPRNTGDVTRVRAVQPFRQGLRNLSGQSGGKDLLGNEWLPPGTLGYCRERVGCLSTLVRTMEKRMSTKYKPEDNYADGYQDGKEEILSDLLAIIDEWSHVPTLKLRAVEMTAQEVRSVTAVLAAIRSRLSR